ncbi:MAG: ribbon-helix-helix protein, CopG family [Phycisphaerales bacterium]
MAKETVAFRLEPELIERMDRLAERLKMTRTDVMERCIQAGLKEGEDHLSKLENPLIRAALEAVLSIDPSTSKEDLAVFRNAIEHVKSTSKKRRAADAK